VQRFSRSFSFSINPDTKSTKSYFLLKKPGSSAIDRMNDGVRILKKISDDHTKVSWSLGSRSGFMNMILSV